MVVRRPSASPPTSPERVSVSVPKQNRDPIWSLKPWPVTVTIEGYDLTIPAMPAADWLATLMQPDLDMDTVISELIPELDELLLEVDLPLEEVYRTCLEIIDTVSARPWWIALRLVSITRDSWSIISSDLLKIDANKVSLSAWLDHVLLILLNHMKPEETAMFTMKLELPPEGEETKQEDIEMSADVFLRMGS